ncbi:VanW family protein [Nonomuraea turkmeniaca]|uniref:VanW family protein n=1 Tax=Nonomuraea turkmeniaca TaxID=103838 RepID=UPI00147740B3|nr:VanW family protein [Nonomuraea turkmeniaca]
MIAVPLLAYALPATILAGETPRGTRVAGIDIGGLSAADARARLERELGKRGARSLTLTAAGETARLAPAKLGLAFDVPATVEAAMDGAAAPAGIFRSLFGSPRDLQPQIRVDERVLADGLGKFAKAVDTKPRQGGIRYRGVEPQAILPKPGRALDREAAARAVREAFAGNRPSIALTTQVVRPSVTAAEVRRVATTVARSAVAAPLTLANGAKKAPLSPTQIAAGLRFVANGQGELRPAFDADDVLTGLEKQLIDAEQRPRDASFTITKGRPRVIPARPGRGIDAKALSTTVSDALASGRRSVDAPLAETQPRVTTAEAKKLGIKEKVSSFTTQHPCCAPRVTNIHRIADIVDGYVVQPGETFSLNGIVGKRDKARGFVEAPMILNNRFVNDVGGGVSQFATTMFNAVFFGGFQDVQHRAHQYYISRYPAGRESTVSYPQPDFRWRNDSPYGVLVKTSYTGTSITVDFWSTKRYEIESQSSPRYDTKSFPTLTESGSECIPMEGVEGFAIDVWRIFKQDGKVVRKQRFHTVYDPEPRLTCK